MLQLQPAFRKESLFLASTQKKKIFLTSHQLDSVQFQLKHESLQLKDNLG